MSNEVSEFHHPKIQKGKKYFLHINKKNKIKYICIYIFPNSGWKNGKMVILVIEQILEQFTLIYIFFKKKFEDITMVLAIFHMERVPKNERGKKP